MLGGAAVVAAALELLSGDLPARRAIAVWGAAGIFGAAAGPALGGALTPEARHGGVVLGLAVLTSLFTADLEDQQVAAQRAGVPSPGAGGGAELRPVAVSPGRG